MRPARKLFSTFFATVLPLLTGAWMNTAYASITMTLIPNAVNPGDTRTFFLGVNATAGGTGTGPIGCVIVTPTGIGASFTNVRASASNGHAWNVNMTQSAGTIIAYAAVAGDYAS